MDAVEPRHPARAAVAERVRRWTFEADPAGYRFAPGRYGWYRQDDQPDGVATLNAADTAELPAAVAEARCHFPGADLTLWLNDRERVARLGRGLEGAGARRAFDASYLLHTASAPGPVPRSDGALRLVGGDDGNLADFVRIKLQAFMATEHQPSRRLQQRELGRRRAELARSGRFLMIYRGREPLAGISYYRAGPDRFINLLVTRVPYRRRGLGQWLVSAALAECYDEGAESVVVVPEPAVAGLYRRAGFLDEILWRRAYRLPAPRSSR